MAGEQVWQAVEVRRVKRYSTMYDDTKGFVPSKMPRSFDDAEELLVNALRARRFVMELRSQGLRGSPSCRYGWREEYTMHRFKGGTDKLIVTALALRHALSNAMVVHRMQVEIDECVRTLIVAESRTRAHAPWTVSAGGFPRSKTQQPRRTRTSTSLPGETTGLRRHQRSDRCRSPSTTQSCSEARCARALSSALVRPRPCAALHSP